MTHMLDDSWVRIQVYVPEPIRYKLRLVFQDANDSKNVRKILYALLSDNPTEILDLIDKLKEKN